MRVISPSGAVLKSKRSSAASWSPEPAGVTFTGHPGLRKLYLPGDFEGNPLRKDFPLVSRLVKPWPGIVDIEPMPGEPEGDDAEEAES